MLQCFYGSTFSRAKGAVKLHTQYDVRTSISVFMHVTAAAFYDVNAIDQTTFEAGNFYIFDRGYLDFDRFYFIHQAKSYFVIRAKNNLQFERKYSSPVGKEQMFDGTRQDTLKNFILYRDIPKKSVG